LLTYCGHPVCISCLNQLQTSDDNLGNCPVCRKQLSRIGRDEQPYQIDMQINSTSSARTFSQAFEEEEESLDESLDEPLEEPLILIIDVSGSMRLPSSDISNLNPSTRISLVSYLAKMLSAIAHHMNLDLYIYSFSEQSNLIGKHVRNDSEQKYNSLLQNLSEIKPESSTNMIVGLREPYIKHGNNAKYIFFTDGDPTEPVEQVNKYIKTKFKNTWLNMVSFGSNLSTTLMQTIGNLNSKNARDRVNHTERRNVCKNNHYNIQILIYFDIFNSTS